jgi:hypothetical protein
MKNLSDQYKYNIIESIKVQIHWTFQKTKNMGGSFQKKYSISGFSFLVII